MSNPAVCKVCGKALDEHALVFRFGVAHAAVYRDNRLVSCSELHAQADYMSGQIATMQTTIGSLRWHAGRLRTKGRVWTADDLVAHADKLRRRVTNLSRQFWHYYPWGRL